MVLKKKPVKKKEKEVAPDKEAWRDLSTIAQGVRS